MGRCCRPVVHPFVPAVVHGALVLVVGVTGPPVLEGVLFADAARAVAAGVGVGVVAVCEPVPLRAVVGAFGPSGVDQSFQGVRDGT
jgi:hypothetical protein